MKFNGSIINNSLPARHIAIAGSTGSGKSTFAKKEILKPVLKRVPRLMVFDPKNEYGDKDKFFSGCEISASSPGELAHKLKDKIDKPFKARLIGVTREDFEAWAKLTFAMGSCIALAEELGAFTSPGKASPNWHRLISQGRAKGCQGIQIIGITQSPAESDKTLIRNATLIHTGRLTRAGDREYMAKEMDISVNEITALKDLEYIQRNMQTHETYSGKISFSR